MRTIGYAPGSTATAMRASGAVVIDSMSIVPGLIGTMD